MNIHICVVSEGMYVGISAFDERRIESTTVLYACAAGPSVAGPAISFTMRNGSGFQKIGVSVRSLTGQRLCVNTRGCDAHQ